MGEERTGTHSHARDALAIDVERVIHARECAVEKGEILLDALLRVADDGSRRGEEWPLEGEVAFGFHRDADKAVVVDGCLDLGLVQEALATAPEPMPKKHHGELFVWLEVAWDGEQKCSIVDGVGARLDVGATGGVDECAEGWRVSRRLVEAAQLGGHATAAAAARGSRGHADRGAVRSRAAVESRLAAGSCGSGTGASPAGGV